MLAVLFEVTPKPQMREPYLERAAALRPHVERIDGFVSVERFQSERRPQTLLSYSLWRDEAALTAWRTLDVHHQAQIAGREKLFEDYRLRIAQVVEQRVAGQPDWRPARLTAYRDPAAHAPRYVVVVASELPLAAAGDAAPSDRFTSLTRPGSCLALFDPPGQDEARGLAVALIARNPDAGVLVRICEVERDYGLFDRAEAPQYYPPVARPSAAAQRAPDMALPRVRQL